jgi:hypothetical protein
MVLDDAVLQELSNLRVLITGDAEDVLRRASRVTAVVLDKTGVLAPKILGGPPKLEEREAITALRTELQSCSSEEEQKDCRERLHALQIRLRGPDRPHPNAAAAVKALEVELASCASSRGEVEPRPRLAVATGDWMLEHLLALWGDLGFSEDASAVCCQGLDDAAIRSAVAEGSNLFYSSGGSGGDSSGFGAPKGAIVKALQEIGHTVLFVGDDVNDVPALKAADLAVAVANGAPEAKECAEVLLMGDLDAIANVMRIGRSIKIWPVVQMTGMSEQINELLGRIANLKAANQELQELAMSAAAAPTFLLNSGQQMPAVGLGTWVGGLHH